MRKLALAVIALTVFAVAPTFGATRGIEVTRAGFTPNKTTVDYGDTVTWTNRDNANHQVVSERGEFPASPVLAPNQTYSFTFMGRGILCLSWPRPTIFRASSRSHGRSLRDLLCSQVESPPADMSSPLTYLRALQSQPPLHRTATLRF